MPKLVGGSVRVRPHCSEYVAVTHAPIQLLYDGHCMIVNAC